MAKKKAKPKSTEETFEQALAGLEASVAELESGELGLDEALERYEQGVSRLKQCHEALQNAQRRIEVLSGVDADGNPVTTPFKADPTATTSGKSTRSQKRSAGSGPSAASDDVDDLTRLF